MTIVLHYRGAKMDARLLLLAVLFLTSAAHVQAQAPETPAAASAVAARKLRSDSAGTCARASALLRSPLDDRERWAVNAARRCGERGGSALAAYLRRVAHAGAPSEQRHAFAGGDHFVDQSLFEAQAQLAEDRSVPARARVLALRNLLSQVVIPSLYFSDSLMIAHSAGCIPSRAVDLPTAHGRRLTKVAPGMVRSLAERLASDSTEDANVRRAAACAAANAERFSEVHEK